jgi:hypothetical protein
MNNKVTLLNKSSWADDIQADSLSENDRVVASCTIAREKIEIGDYDAGCSVLRPWWKLGEWPNQTGLD